MKLYRYVRNDEKLDIEHGFDPAPYPTHIGTASGFYYTKPNDSFGKYFFLFKEDAINFIKETLYLMVKFNGIDFTEKTFEKTKFYLMEIEVPKAKILKNIGVGLYQFASTCKFELRYEVLLPHKDTKESFAKQHRFVEISASEILNSKTRKQIKKIKKINKLDFNLKRGMVSNFDFKNDAMKVNEESVLKKLDKIEMIK